jgi:vancomycin resistance protein YoaR
MFRRVAPLLASVVLAAFLAGGGWYWERRATDAVRDTVPAEGVAASGIKVDGEAIPSPAAYGSFVEAKAQAILDRRVSVAYGGKVIEQVSLRELGAEVDVDAVVESIERIAHEGSLYRRAAEARAAKRGKYNLSLPVHLPVEPFAERVAGLKEELDVAALPARRKIDRDASVDEVVAHRDGAYFDAHAATEAILRAALAEDPTVEIAAFRAVPAATKDEVARANVGTVVASFETRFGGPPGRNRNIERATSQLHGLVLMPHDTVSFNETVGPRSVDNGFFSAPEIYKGEMRAGIGGGSCQVASTLYAAAFFGGLDVVERRNHSRPSGYIRPGMDATVSFPVLDLRIKNPYDFPVVVSAKSDGGVLRFELLGKERRVDVALATETLGIHKFSRKIEKAPFLPAGEFRVKQRGKRGLSIKRLKTVKDLKTGEEQVEESRDLYPPTQEIVLAGPGVTDDDLPPLDPPAEETPSEVGGSTTGRAGDGV